MIIALVQYEFDVRKIIYGNQKHASEKKKEYTYKRDLGCLWDPVWFINPPNQKKKRVV